MTDQDLGLIKRAEAVSDEIKTIFRKAMETSLAIGEVRGKGFMLSLKIVKNKEPADGEKVFGLMTEMINKGILNSICGRYGNPFRFMPPLTTPKAYFEKAAEICLALLKEREKELTA